MGYGRVSEAGTETWAAPPIASTGAICGSAPGTDRHLLLCLSTNTQIIKLVDGGWLSVTRH